MTKHPELNTLNKLNVCRVECLTFRNRRSVDIILDGSDVNGLHLLSLTEKQKRSSTKNENVAKGESEKSST